jgi:hypothetical protein
LTKLQQLTLFLKKGLARDLFVKKTKYKIFTRVAAPVRRQLHAANQTWTARLQLQAARASPPANDGVSVDAAINRKNPASADMEFRRPAFRQPAGQLQLSCPDLRLVK